MHPKEFENIISLEPIERYNYFIKKIADSEKLYTLLDENGNYITSEIDGNMLFPLWSAVNFAETCKTQGWQNYLAKELDLDDFKNETMRMIAESNFLINVFPIYERTGFVVNLDEFTRDLNEELEKIE